MRPSPVPLPACVSHHRPEENTRNPDGIDMNEYIARSAFDQWQCLSQAEGTWTALHLQLKLKRSFTFKASSYALRTSDCLFLFLQLSTECVPLASASHRHSWCSSQDVHRARNTAEETQAIRSTTVSLQSPPKVAGREADTHLEHIRGGQAGRYLLIILHSSPR